MSRQRGRRLRAGQMDDSIRATDSALRGHSTQMLASAAPIEQEFSGAEPRHNRVELSRALRGSV
jgi:hypothetical protein